MVRDTAAPIYTNTMLSAVALNSICIHLVMHMWLNPRKAVGYKGADPCMISKSRV